MDGNLVDAEIYNPHFDPTVSVGASGYAWIIGGTLKIGFDWEYLLSKWAGF